VTSPNSNVIRTGQSLTPGDLMVLYTIDLSPIGVPVQYNFTPSTSKTGKITFRGIDYVPLDVKCEGFEYDGTGSLPRPEISITNVTRVLSTAAVLQNDILGARLIRTRTYGQFLDNGPTPDPEAAYGQDIYRFHQKTQHNKRLIRWTLAAAMDQEGIQLPKRQVLRDVCLWRYRRTVLNTDGSFAGYDYTGVQCPYAGSQAYDVNGNPTTPDKDAPGRHVNDCCRVRFGSTAQLPFGGFPGVGRIAV
jgi:lambda family phage minor tail protein L